MKRVAIAVGIGVAATAGILATPGTTDPAPTYRRAAP